jgi:hypothetical protein
MSSSIKARRAGPRDLQYFVNPDRWPQWPFLPLIRPSLEGRTQCGILYDARGASGSYGFSTTVFLSNLFALPRREADFLALPRLSYDTLDELADDGWSVD